MKNWLCALFVVFAVAGTAAAQVFDVKVTVEADKTKVTETIQSIAGQAKEKVIVESVVKGEVTLSLKDASFETALTKICDSCKLEWRKVYIAKDAKVLEQPDRLAATVRLLTSMGYPDMVVAGSSTGKLALFARDEKAVGKVDDKLAQQFGMAPVYLVTSDARAAAKLVEKDKEKKSDATLDEYTKSAKALMDSWLKMTPEQQEQATVEGLNMLDQYGPNYAAAAMRAALAIDPEMLKQKLVKQTQAMFDLTQEERRALLRLNIQMSAMLTPEQQQILQEDSKAVQEEMAGQR